MSEPMDEVRANTTPGTDPRVEEMSREQAADRSVAGNRFEDRPIEGGPTGDEAAADPTMHRHHVDDRGIEGRGVDDRGVNSDATAYGNSVDERRMDDPVADYRTRFADAQSRFIDDPKSALDDARSVVEEAIDKYMDSLRMDAGAGSGDTEQMRRAMQRYRDLFDRIAGGSQL
jgi:hypothetical protein